MFQTTTLAPSYWMGVLYGASYDYGYGSAIDSDGNIIVTGINENTYQAFVLAKYSTSGSLLWQRRLAVPSADSFGSGVAVDSSNNIYICGYGGSTTVSAYIAKYDSSGTLQWQRSLGTSSKITYGYSIAVDSAGSGVYVVGNSNATLSGSDARITKYDTSGTLQWQYRLYTPTTGSEVFRGVAVDTSGNTYISGYNFNSSVSNNSMLLVKYNSSGTIQWQRRLDSAGGDDLGIGAATDSSSNAYICGYGTGSVYFSFAKYNSTGTIQWQRWLTGSAGEAYGITADSSGNVYVCGQTYGTGSKVLIVKYNSSGTIQWQRSITTNDASPVDIARSIYVDAAGTTITITGTSAKNGINRLFVAKLPADGSLTGNYTLDGLTFTYAASSLTAATASYTASTTTLTSATGALTSATSSLTASTPTLTSATVTL